MEMKPKIGAKTAERQKCKEFYLNFLKNKTTVSYQFDS